MSLRRKIWVGLLLAAAFSGAAAGGDEPAKRETEAETIAKCLNDLTAKDMEVRKRAVLLLGKYNRPNAVAGLVRSLKDPKAVIRRSALLALIQKPADQKDSEAMLRLLSDPDVSIRRLVSSHLIRLLRVYYYDLRPPLQPADVLPQEVKQAIARAYTDPDATIRKNMLSAWYLCRAVVRHETVLALLKDPDGDVRLLALNTSAMILQRDSFVDRVKFLARDQDRLIRLRLTRILGNQRYQNGAQLLETLTKDKNFQIVSEAWLSLYRGGRLKVWPELRQSLDDPQMKTDQAARIIRCVPYMRAKGETILLELMRHEKSAYRLAALETYGRSYWRTQRHGPLVKLLEDPHPPVRAAAGALLKRGAKLPVKAIKAMAASRHANVRTLALDLSLSLARQDAQEILMELILDDQSQVRRHALALVAKRELDGWEEIMADTLDDEDPQVQHQVVVSLLQNGGKAAIAVLKKYAEDGEDAKLRELIQQYLNQLEGLRPRLF